MASSGLASATDGKLKIRLEFKPGVARDRARTRTMLLHFRNASHGPLRIYLVADAYFRGFQSSVMFLPEGQRFLDVPGVARRHGYQVTEKDFHLLKPGETRTFIQTFTIDPVGEGRRVGFPKGRKIKVAWSYENKIIQWKGGTKPFRGPPTKQLFGGKKIPYLWTGKLEVGTTWTVPD